MFVLSGAAGRQAHHGRALKSSAKSASYLYKRLILCYSGEDSKLARFGASNTILGNNREMPKEVVKVPEIPTFGLNVSWLEKFSDPDNK